MGKTHSHLCQLILSSDTMNHLFPHLWLLSGSKEKKKRQNEAIRRRVRKGRDRSLNGRHWSLRSWHPVPGLMVRVAKLVEVGVGEVWG